MIQRSLNILKNHSFFLFGPRGVGKSSFLQSFFSDEALYLDLLNPEISDELIAHPNNLISILRPYQGKKKWIVIDEVQKAPQLLDIVHQEIFKKNFLFALTGSSARKLKRGTANLLAGRALWYNMFPLTRHELKEQFNLNQYLQYGGLPEVILSQSEEFKKKYLKSYVQTYISEEIVAEQIVRNLAPFRRFIDVAGTINSEPLVASNVARDINADQKSVMRYFEIFEDTLIGFQLPAFHSSPRKRYKKSPKFYFFDTGVVRAMSNQIDFPLIPKSFEYGKLFENFLINEIRANLSYVDIQFELSYLRVDDQLEIDLIIEKNRRRICCEIKSTDHVHQDHAHALNCFAKDFPNDQLLLISQDPTKKQFGRVEAVHWQEALEIIKKF